MKIEVESKAFGDALKAVRKPLRQSPVGLPALTGVLLRHEDGPLKIVGTDLEMWLERTVDALVEGSDGDSALLPSSLLTDLVNAAPTGRVVLETDDAEARFDAGGFTATIRQLPKDDYPERRLSGETGPPRS